MSEQQRIRFISEKPILAQTFRQLYLGILPKDLHKWAFDWAEDLGTIVRSRSFMAYTIVQLSLFLGLGKAIRLAETQGTILSKIFQTLGIKL